MVCCCKSRGSSLLLVLTYLWLWNNCIHNLKAAETNSLKPGDTLNSTLHLCSQNRNFCIQFVDVTIINQPTYLEIVRNGNFEIWTANRNQPITNGSGILSLDKFGVLKIESQDWNPIVLYSPPPLFTKNLTIVATLLDSANFVVQQLNPNGSTKKVLWQSFDYPTDTLCPGMKLGVNHKTGHTWSLVSWVSETVPSSGTFKLEWEPKEGELVITRIGKVLWKSGKLIKNRFEHIPEDSQRTYNFTIVSNEDEDYFTFTTSNEEPLRWTLFETGQVKSTDGKDIAKANMCYGYNNDEGCQKWEIPKCRDSSEVFENRRGYLNLPSNVTSYEKNSSYGIGDCQAICWSNCTCFGFQSFDDRTGCIFYSNKSWKDVMLVSVGQNFNIIVKKSYGRGTKKWITIWLSVVIAIALLIICTSILFLVKNKRKRVVEDKRKRQMKTDGTQSIICEETIDLKDLEDELNKGRDFKVFSYESVMEATNNFSSENKLGQGGFGPIYKGILPTGREVALKRLSKTSGQGIVEFKNEIKLICELQHKNLVQIIGCCICEQERILIYEYMSNKSLDFFLFDSTRSKLLNWSM